MCVDLPKLRSVFVGLLLTLFPSIVTADLLLYEQGFETDTAGWRDSMSTPVWAGLVDRVATGTGGVSSFSGGFHGLINEGPHPTAPTFSTAPFTDFGGYRTNWDGGWTSSAQVYLDPTWSTGEGFDYSAAATAANGNFLRDFIFHIARDDNGLWVSGSNTSNWGSAGNRLKINQATNPFAIQSAGWYTLEHVFRDQAGVLAVDLNFYDASQALLWTTTRSNLNDAIANLGGNRYGWFTVVTVGGGLHVDDFSLVSRIPEPTLSLSVLLLSAWCCGVRRKRG